MRGALVVCLVCGLTGPALAGGKAEDPGQQRQACVEHYKKKRYEKARACFERLLAVRPDDHELHRLIGATQAQLGNRAEAYRCYRTYVERCPDCMYAPAVTRILDDYEKVQAAAADPAPPAGPGSSIKTTLAARAKALVDKAEALVDTRPAEAGELAREAQVLVGPDDPSHRRAARLLERLAGAQPR